MLKSRRRRLNARSVHHRSSDSRMCHLLAARVRDLCRPLYLIRSLRAERLRGHGCRSAANSMSAQRDPRTRPAKRFGFMLASDTSCSGPMQRRSSRLADRTAPANRRRSSVPPTLLQFQDHRHLACGPNAPAASTTRAAHLRAMTTAVAADILLVRHSTWFKNSRGDSRYR